VSHADENIHYRYDAKGNMVMDQNKGIAIETRDLPDRVIIYNHMNLPSAITVAHAGNIWYTYDALGNKLEKKVSDDSTHTIAHTTYIENRACRHALIQSLLFVLPLTFASIANMSVLLH
jgi:YD repeat-containing protein